MKLELSKANDRFGTKSKANPTLDLKLKAKDKSTIDLELKAKPISQANDEIGI